MEQITQIGIPIASFFVGIGVAVGVVRTQINGLGKTVEKNCADIEEARKGAFDNMMEIRVRLARIEERLGVKD